ncbi:hypothetical protein ACFXJ5_03580 [Streptomyces sp. NPDC059373]
MSAKAAFLAAIPLAGAEGAQSVENPDDLGGQDQQLSGGRLGDAAAVVSEVADLLRQRLVDLGDGLESLGPDLAEEFRVRMFAGLRRVHAEGGIAVNATVAFNRMRKPASAAIS